MTAAQALLVSLAACLAGAPVALLVSRDRTLAGWVALGFTLVSSGIALCAAAAVLISGEAAAATLFAVEPMGLMARFEVDGLSAVFVAIIATVAPAAALFSVRYMGQYPEYGVGRYYPSFLVFLAGMYGLVCVSDTMWVFFLFWQMMTVPSYLLIRFEGKEAANVRAANKYMLMMQAACGLAMAGSAILASGGGGGAFRYEFGAVGEGAAALLVARPVLAALGFAMLLVGFGIKAGMWPFGQMWLPDAHPAAPSPVSALLSGVMIKTGVYGLMRSFLWLVPEGELGGFPMAGWGLAIGLLGTVTLFTGTVAALQQEQSKRLLAYSSIGQIGYILFGLGAAMSLLPSGDPALAALGAVGFCGALFHVINHGLFKGLLFLNSGSMLSATGTQDLNRLGGLMRFMPVTGLTVLVGACSVSGVPLTNGFASKWAMYVAAIQGAPEARHLGVCAVIAILTSALTLATFVKFFGASFLSRASKWVSAKAAGGGSMEVCWTMGLPQWFLAGLCAVLGLFPALGVGLIDLALEASRHGAGAMLCGVGALGEGAGWGLAVPGGVGVVMPIAVAGVLGMGFLIARGISRLGAAGRRAAEPWLCGYVSEADCHRYAARGFYGELRRYLKWVGGSAGTGRGEG